MVSQNSLNNRTTDADFNVNHNTAGAATLSVANANAAATAQANMVSLIEPTAFAAFDNWNVNGNATKNWSAGILQSDGAWYLHQSAAAFPSAAVIKATTKGEVTMPRQPMFDARLSVSTGGVTGNGATYVFGNNGGGTVVVDVDQGSDVTIVGGNVTFTNPVPGNYMFIQTYRVSSIAALMTSFNVALLINGGNPFFGTYINPSSSSASVGAVIIVSVPTIIYFGSAGNTVTSNLTISGNIANSAVVDGGALGSGSDSHFRGYLIC